MNYDKQICEGVGWELSERCYGQEGMEIKIPFVGEKTWM